ncbi:DUF1501 domain-containing protein [Paraconexibacter algicola]|uniref:DUF1501 domain-containing protein n=1 Tax=Paraconexibacter algicola TaxID=2133960 RepID=A0A2T4UMK2_9ACTN|nr:DUF1501 domain-containing protein [Paraconexibacter algicola]PTL60449.1 hypothetical protein C7Y72_12770 [Paraconexibacter algicola]
MTQRSHACSGFTRAEMLRSAVARAGDGLPAIEPGMPEPAGTGLTRRTVLVRGFQAGLAVYGASRLGGRAFEEGIAEAAVTGDGRVLVSVFMAGGVDSLSVLAPVGDSRYASLRPTLRLLPGEGTTFSEDTRLMWAPQAAGLRTLHQEGKVAVLPAVGYAGPDQSHFTSQHYWEVGALDVHARHGWMGRFLDRHGSATNPLQGLSLGWSLAPALAAATNPVAAVGRLDDFGMWAPGVYDGVDDLMFDTIGTLGRLPTADPQQQIARTVAAQVDQIRTALGPYQAGITPPTGVSYPTGDFGDRLKGIAAGIAGGLPLRCVALDAPGGYDTHSSQLQTFPDDLRATSDGLLAFQRDLEARGIADRVLVHVWSEFGRRPAQNGDGTDHGAAGVGFLIGSRARGTMVGEFPGLATLDAQDNLRSTSDFRAVYASLLEQWFGVDAAPIIPGAGTLGRYQLVR